LIKSRIGRNQKYVHFFGHFLRHSPRPPRTFRKTRFLLALKPPCVWVCYQIFLGLFISFGPTLWEMSFIIDKNWWSLAKPWWSEEEIPIHIKRKNSENFSEETEMPVGLKGSFVNLFPRKFFFRKIWKLFPQISFWKY